MADQPLSHVCQWRCKNLRCDCGRFRRRSKPIDNVFNLSFSVIVFWEIGGQNIPNDWADFEEDRRMNAKTIPVRWGLQRANVIIMQTIILTLCMNAVIFYFSRVRFEFIYIILSLLVGCYLLLLPALKLYKTKDRAYAMPLFNNASYFPLALLVVVVLKLLIEHVRT